ncbi:MAG: hypothetical protein, partial [Olavius algarvensis Gamma 1 endosymbiont]
DRGQGGGDSGRRVGSECGAVRCGAVRIGAVRCAHRTLRFFHGGMEGDHASLAFPRALLTMERTGTLGYEVL